MKTTVLKDGVNYSLIETPRFKTTVLSVGFYLPLGENNAATSLCLGLMKSGTLNLPDLYSFNRRLATLYGANVSSWTGKLGDTKELRLNLTVNSDRFSLFGENTVSEAASLFFDMIFSRKDCDFLYPQDVFEREKRLLKEKIAGTLNNKRVYAKAKLESVMCDEEPFGIAADGTVEEVEKLTPDDVSAAFKTLLETAFVSVIVIGDKEPENFSNDLKMHFDSVKRKYIGKNADILKPARSEVLYVCEKMNVTQGKLVMGFRSSFGGSDRQTIAARVMTALFGGGPFSKLFLNVREKQSLCYYCAARGVRSKGIILVDSGVETENIEKAKIAILEQIEDIKQGKFSDDDLKFAKLALCDAVKSAESDQPTLLSWYSARALEENPLSLSDTCAAIEKVTVDDIINSAKEFDLDTVYTLLPKEEKQ